MNKFRYIITTLCMVLLSLASQAAVQVDGIWYELQESGNPIVYEATVIRSQDKGGYRGDINIPSIIEYNGISYSVTSIDTVSKSVSG